MRFEQLRNFITRKIKPDRVDEFLMIRCLIQAGGSATPRQLARSFVLEDENQVLLYEEKIKELPLKALSKAGVVEYSEGLISLTPRKLTPLQKAVLRVLCEQKLKEHAGKRGLKIWDEQLSAAETIPDDLRYQALKDSDGRCELCGATKQQRPLHVSHIIPPTREGKTELDNLQVLCSKCSDTKSSMNRTDFRNLVFTESDPTCPFCLPNIKPRVTAENGTVAAIPDRNPVTRGHTLVIPIRHTQDFFSMTTQERRDAENLIRFLRNKAVRQDRTIVGFNIGTNCGTTAGQTIMHAHIHLIPRREDDTLNPKGGVRAVIPDKMSY
jgi:diadenosine tetraphosphate (Ap4A) HIT family hydrolase